MGRFPLRTKIRIPNPQRGILNPRLSRMTLYGDKGGSRAFSLGGRGGRGGGGALLLDMDGPNNETLL